TTALADAVVPVDGTPLPRGELLLLGGDLAYPAASSQEYRYRFIEMFEAARRDYGARQSFVRGRRFTLAALAQNHDWMDSAATFNRYFVRNKSAVPFLGARIPQLQSYFCVKLPRGWWALGFDFALTGEIDRDQFEQFERLVTSGIEVTVDGQHRVHRIAADDRVILIYPEPYWRRPIGGGARPNWPMRYQRLEGLLRERIAMRLSGDLHHYMRSTSPSDGVLVTCGTGGAFAHPTHTRTTTRPVLLREHGYERSIPPQPPGARALLVGLDDAAQQPPDVAFERVEASVYPAARASRRRAWGNLVAFFKTNGSWSGGNWWFAALLGALYWFNAYLNSLPFANSFFADGFKPLSWFTASEFWMVFVLWLKAMVFSPLGFVVNVVMIVACLVMGRETVNELSSTAGTFWRAVTTWGVGLIHALAHVFAVYAVVFWLHQYIGALPWIGSPGASGWAAIAQATVVGVCVFVYGSIVGALIFGLYLALMSWFGFLTNNGYSALGIEDFKGFLRCRIAADGRLHAHFIAIDRVPRRWKATARGAPVWEPEDAAIATRVHDRFEL
ncbi:MAG TPA: hypothetical protein VLE45_08980, partial [Burkholderiaceae bacterium]|nr:hypothetical protein [Burkholderiaceae bacterium]